MDAWRGLVSRAEVDQGMWLLEEVETPAGALALAYGLEEGSRRFYQELADRSSDAACRRLFALLAEAEVRHEDRLWEAYRALPDGLSTGRSAFEHAVVPRALEGGLTPDEVLARTGTFPLTPEDALDLALALEADALDLYLRMAWVVGDEGVRAVFLRTAEEEKAHLRRLGEFREAHGLPEAG